MINDPFVNKKKSFHNSTGCLCSAHDAAEATAGQCAKNNRTTPFLFTSLSKKKMHFCWSFCSEPKQRATKSVSQKQEGRTAKHDEKGEEAAHPPSQKVQCAPKGEASMQ